MSQTLELALQQIGNDIQQVGADINSIGSDIASLETFNTGSTATIAQIQADITALDNTLTALSSAVGTDFGTVSADITALQNAVTQLQADVAAFEAGSGIAQLQTDVSALQSALTTAQVSIATLQSSMTAAQSNITALQSQSGRAYRGWTQAAQGNIIANPTGRNGVGSVTSDGLPITIVNSDVPGLPHRDAFRVQVSGTEPDDRTTVDFGIDPGVELMTTDRFAIEYWIRSTQVSAFQLVLVGKDIAGAQVVAQAFVPEGTILNEWRKVNLVIPAGDMVALDTFEIRVYNSGGVTTTTHDLTGVTCRPIASTEMFASEWGMFNDPAKGDSSRVRGWLNYCIDHNKTAVLDSNVYLDSPVVIDLDGTALTQEHIYLRGLGQLNSGFYVNNPTGGVHFRGVNVSRQHSVNVSDLSFVPNLEFSGYPLKFTGIEGGVRISKAVEIQNVTIGPVQQSVKRDFTEGVTCTGLYRPFFNNLVIFQSIDCNSKWPHVLDITGCYSPAITDCFFNVQRVAGKAVLGIKLGGTNLQGPEGFECYNTTMNGADIGVDLYNVGREPNFKWFGGHVNAQVNAFKLNGVKFAAIRDCLMYNELTNGIFVNLLDCDGLELNNQYRTIQPAESQRLVSAVAVGGKTGAVMRNIRITDFGLFNNQNSTLAPYVFGSMAENCEVYLPNVTGSADNMTYPASLVQTVTGATNIVLYQGDTVRTWGDANFTVKRTDVSIGNIGVQHNVGNNSNGNSAIYAAVTSGISANTAGSEQGYTEHQVMMDGVRSAAVRLTAPGAQNETSMVLCIQGANGTLTFKRVKKGALSGGVHPLVVDP